MEGSIVHDGLDVAPPRLTGSGLGGLVTTGAELESELVGAIIGGCGEAASRVALTKENLCRS